MKDDPLVCGDFQWGASAQSLKKLCRTTRHNLFENAEGRMEANDPLFSL